MHRQVYRCSRHYFWTPDVGTWKIFGNLKFDGNWMESGGRLGKKRSSPHPGFFSIHVSGFFPA
jgi:hypothetical protein